MGLHYTLFVALIFATLLGLYATSPVDRREGEEQKPSIPDEKEDLKKVITHFFTGNLIFSSERRVANEIWKMRLKVA